MSPAPKKSKKKAPSKREKSNPVLEEGQKRILVAGAILGGALLYRTLHKGSQVNRVSNSSATGSITPFVPQSPILVPPGESVYDPNSEALLNTPPAPTATGTTTPVPPVPTPPTSATAPPHFRTTSTKRKPAKRKLVKVPRVMTRPAGGGGVINKPKPKTRATGSKAPGTRKRKKDKVLQG